MSRWFWATLRLLDVTITKEDLEAQLGQTVMRFEPSRSGMLYYAQVEVPANGDLWPGVTDFIDQIGPKVLRLTQSEAIGAASLDLGLPFDESQAMVSALIPSVAAESLGRNDISITVSVYLTARAE